VHSDFIRVKYHKDQANDKDYSHEGLGFTFKKWQADQVAKHFDSKESEVFAADKVHLKLVVLVVVLRTRSTANLLYSTQLTNYASAMCVYRIGHTVKNLI